MYYEEGCVSNGVMGFYAKGYKTIDEATNAIKKFIEEDSDDFLEEYEDREMEPFVFDESNVKQSTMHTHKACGIETIDSDGYCCECTDHYFTSPGRTIFTYPM